jgi:hypothetical protein
MLVKEIEAHHVSRKMLNIGSCGLHIIHNAFRNALEATEWKIAELLSAAYRLFKDSPARREDFTTVTDSDEFPLKFCSHRWVENVTTLERMLSMLKNLRKYINAAETKKCTRPQTKSYQILKDAIFDKSLEVKLHAIVAFAKDVESLLKVYQTDEPVVPFLVNDLLAVMKNCLRRFMKHTVVSSLQAENACDIDLDNHQNYRELTEMDMGFSANNLSKSLVKESPNKFLTVTSEYRLMLIVFSRKVLQKSPIISPLVRHLCFLDPNRILQSPDDCRRKLSSVLNLLVKSGRIIEARCDAVLREFDQMIEGKTRENLSNFSRKTMRLDEFYHEILSQERNFSNLWFCTKLVLCLSHGQAGVERGFSINRQIETENLSKKNLVAQRIIIDHVKHHGGLASIEVPNGMLLSAAGARKKYHFSLEEEKKRKASHVNKRALEIEVSDLKSKRRRLESDIRELFKSADNEAERAESLSDFTALAKSNAMRRSAKEKENNLQSISKDISHKSKELSRICDA